MDLMTDYLTPSQAGRELHLTRCRVWELAKMGRIPAVKTPNGFIFPRWAIAQEKARRKARSA